MSDVLVNFVYCHPVGHAVEAVQHCLGYRRADPGRRIGVVVSPHTGFGFAAMAAGTPWLTLAGRTELIFSVDNLHLAYL